MKLLFVSNKFTSVNMKAHKGLATLSAIVEVQNTFVCSVRGASVLIVVIVSCAKGWNSHNWPLHWAPSCLFTSLTSGTHNNGINRNDRRAF